MNTPNTPSDLFNQQATLILSNIDTSVLSPAQSAIVALLKGGGSIHDYCELFTLAHQGMSLIYPEENHDEELNQFCKANREILDELKQVIERLSALNGKID